MCFSYIINNINKINLCEIGMIIENNKKLLDYAKYLWLKEKKFIPFPYILLNSSKCLHKDLIKFVSKFAYSQKNQKFERIYVDFDELAKKDINDIIKNYALLTKYKSRLK